MRKVAICTDSSALLPASDAVRLGVAVAPIAVELDGKPFAEGRHGRERFYERLPEGARATTAQPSPGRLLDLYEGAAAAGSSEVLSIHLDARLSATVTSAELAARDAPIPVTVVDTGTASFGVTVCVRAAALALEHGGTSGEAARKARGAGARLRNVFVAPKAPTARIRSPSGWAVLELRDGRAEPLAECAGVEEAVAQMVERVAAFPGPIQAAVGHAAAVVEPAADALSSSLLALPQVVGGERYRVGPAVAAHAGALTFGVFWWPAERSHVQEEREATPS